VTPGYLQTLHHNIRKAKREKEKKRKREKEKKRKRTNKISRKKPISRPRDSYSLVLRT
jgi:hypothetical protein